MGISSGTADNLPALTGTKLDVMDQGTQRYFAQEKGVSQIRCDILTGDYFLAYLQSLRGQNVSLFTIRIRQERDTGATVRIVLDSFYSGRYLVFFTFEIDDTVTSFVTATDITHRPATLVVATPGFVYESEQGLFRLRGRDFLERAGSPKALTRRSGFVFL